MNVAQHFALSPGAINLTPLLYVVAAAGVLFFIFWIGFFLLMIVGSVLGYLSGQDNELGEGIVFYGAVAIVLALVILAFTHHLVAFE
jgi:hypothetical protein